MSTLRARFVGLTALLALASAVVGFPAALLAIGAVPRIDDFAWSRLAGPDDGTLAVAVVGVVAWLAWMAFTASVAVELVARIRGIPSPRVPGFALPQLTASRLIALASLVFVAVPLAQQAASTPRAATSAPLEADAPVPAHVDTRTQPTPLTPDSTTPSTVVPDEVPTAAYTVKRGDSLWRIAEAQLGDGRRYVELVTLNQKVLKGRPDFLMPGTVLRIPAAVAEAPRDEPINYVVRPGDTLSEIAEDVLGEAALQSRIFDVSREVVQTDGQRLVDPDLILPGWKLTIPQAEAPPLDQTRRRDDEPPPRHAHDPKVIAEAPESHNQSPSDPDTQPDSIETADLDDEGASNPDWVMPGLTGAGGMLAGALLLVLRQHRRTQMRYRRPGTVIAPPGPELLPVQKTAHLTGTVTGPAIATLDRVLRDLAARCSEPPRVLVVRLGDSRTTVRLAHPADLPYPWTGAGSNWSVETPTEVADDPDQVAPYPMLVSVGQDDDSQLVLLNLEELGSVTLVGEPERAGDLVRHIAAELALNPWSSLVEIDALGVGAELASIDPVRLRFHDESDTSFLEHIAAALDIEASSGDPDRFRAMLTTDAHDGGQLRRITKIITESPMRTGAVLVTVDTKSQRADAAFRLTSAGRLLIDELDLNLTPAGLSADEAAACAGIVDLTRSADAIPAPLSFRTDGERALGGVAGAGLTETTERRPDGPAGPDSLLPLATADYVETAATTAEDLQRLAPVVPTSARDADCTADTSLDEDLALWFDVDAHVPRLTLLGPVNARAYGNPRAIAKRKPFYVELLAFLALRPDGVSSHDLADAFGLTVPRARTDIGVVRSWLGTDRRSGVPHLPNANATNGTGNGAQRYQVQGVLVDLDLFRRLRARAQRKGSAGIGELQTALKLVTGEPFSHLRPAGWSWLLDGDRLDHIMTCAVADVGHILTTHALAIGDLDLARWSAETSISAAPYDDVCRLDLIRVAAESGHGELAQRQLIDEVLNRSDDGLGPVDLPDRTADILGRHPLEGGSWST